MSDDLAERIRQSIEAAQSQLPVAPALQGTSQQPSATSPMETSIPTNQDRVELILSLFKDFENAPNILREIDELPDDKVWMVSLPLAPDRTVPLWLTKAMVRQQVVDRLSSLPAVIQALSSGIAIGG